MNKLEDRRKKKKRRHTFLAKGEVGNDVDLSLPTFVGEPGSGKLTKKTQKQMSVKRQQLSKRKIASDREKERERNKETTAKAGNGKWAEISSGERATQLNSKKK
jgi:hypothetical protein